ncbi:MAG: DEAD/DEAH box helicase [Rhodomicrobium sp.]
MTISLRPYQQDAVAAVFSSWQAGYRAPLLVLPTGAGKTITFAEVARRTQGRVLVIAHRRELIWQAQDKIELVTGIRPSVDMGYMGAKANDRIVVATVQGLARGRRIEGGQFELAIIDEAHHALGDNQYGAVLDAIGAPKILGVTATPYRADKKALAELFDDNPFSLGMLDLIELAKKTEGGEGLCDITVKTLPVKVDLRGVHVRQGDFVDAEVADALAPLLDPLADLIAAEYADKKLLAFCPLRATSRQWTEALIARGLAAAHVQGDSPDRTEILAAYARNEVRFLSNSNVLTEGFDQPDIDAILVLRPTKSRGLFAQMIGRGTRLFPGKDKLLVLDPCFVSERHNVMSASSLVARDDMHEKRVADLMEHGLTLKEAVEAEEQAAKASLADSLARSMKEASRRTAYERRLAELALVLNVAELASYEPTMAWHSQPPSDKQLKALDHAGIDPSAIWCKGLASAVMDKLAERRKHDLATFKQARYARRLGHPSPETLTFADASIFINERMRAA